jgi:hypothetical protein
MWKLKDEGRAENAQKIKSLLEGLSGRIGGLKSAVVGIDLKAEDTSFDAVLVSEFDSLEALAEYKIHPEHVKISAFVKSVRTDRKTVDYEIPE